MSGIVKGIKKFFRKVGDAAKNVWDGVKKIAKPVMLAAAAYFTAGTAATFFAEPAAGLGAAMSSTASSMWSGVTSVWDGATSMFSGGEAAAGGAMDSAASGAAAGGNPISGTQFGAVGQMGGGSGMAGGSAGMEGMAAPPAASGGGLVSNVVNGAGKAASGVGNFVKNNPVPAMMLGQGASSAVTSYNERQTQKDTNDRKDKLRRERGFFGMDQVGNQIDLPTSSGQGLVGRVALQSPSIAAPTVQNVTGNNTATQQQAVQPSRNVPMTPSQLLELQRRSYLQNKDGRG